MTPADFGTARAKLGLTQFELCTVMGYTSPARISAIEHGGRGGNGNVPAQAARLMDAYVGGWRSEDWPG